MFAQNNICRMRYAEELRTVAAVLFTVVLVLFTAAVVLSGGVYVVNS